MVGRSASQPACQQAGSFHVNSRDLSEETAILTICSTVGRSVGRSVRPSERAVELMSSSGWLCSIGCPKRANGSWTNRRTSPVSSVRWPAPSSQISEDVRRLFVNCSFIRVYDSLNGGLVCCLFACSLARLARLGSARLTRCIGFAN